MELVADTGRTTPAGLQRLTDVETAVGMPFGAVGMKVIGEDPSVGGRGRSRARAVLEALAAEALASGPVVVTFSGGRDSSAVLAVAAHVARRDGLPLPVPLTLEYPGLDEADERSWQSAILDHLGLVHVARRLTITDQQRALGPRVRASLARHGLVWPAMGHAYPAVDAVDPGTLLCSGEGGDEVLGVRRVTPFTVTRAVVRSGHRPGRGHLRDMAGTVTGAALPLGAWSAWNPWIDTWPWLRGRAREAQRRFASLQARGPWRYDVATRALVRGRVPVVLAHNLQVLAEERGVRWRHPLLDPRFARALGADGGAWGFRGRTDTMRFLFSDLLPEPVLARRSKASFNGSRFGEDERDFASGWDGNGVDDRLVDVAELRRHWLGERPAGLTVPLLHQAWLAQSPGTSRSEAA